MSRLDAWKARLSAKTLPTVSVASLQPTDVIVIETDEQLSEQDRVHILGVAQEVWPRHKVVILDEGMKLKVIRDGAA
jgi:hypothetical protein